MDRPAHTFRRCWFSLLLKSATRTLWLLSQKLCRKLAGFEDAPLGDDTGNEFRRCHVESWIVDRHIFGRDRMAAVDGRHL